jgi:hypothetical protein
MMIFVAGFMFSVNSSVQFVSTKNALYMSMVEFNLLFFIKFF